MNRDIRTGQRWSLCEDAFLREEMMKIQPPSLEDIANILGREAQQVRNRWLRIIQPGMKKGPFNLEEDRIIIECVERGIRNWSEIAMRVPGRMSKQCRERYVQLHALNTSN